MGDLATLVTAGSGISAFVAVIAYLLTSNRADRKEYQEAIDRAEKRADKAEVRAAASEQVVDTERQARRAAEDRAARAERELDRHRDGAP